MIKAMLTRRTFAVTAMATGFAAGIAHARQRRTASVSIRDVGAVADAVTVNTVAIQCAIDDLSVQGGGTVIIPAGIFVSGALFLKPGVDLHLQAGAVLRCSTDMRHFPPRRTRIEGHLEEHFTPALINAQGCNGLRVSGTGTLDGAGRPIWDRFWQLRRTAPDPATFPNLGLERARLALIEDSSNITVEGITFKDSQFWNLHLYRCRHVTVRNARFEVPDDYQQAPSSDGIDLDSCQDVLVDGCYFSVTDDCIAAKGSKGPDAMADASSPPVERIRVRNCHFRRGHQAFTCGSEATIVRDVVIEHCRVTGAINLLMLKLRPDTPQRYERIVVRDIVVDNPGGRLILIEPWAQYRDLKGQEPPRSVVRDITLRGITGRFGAFGIVRPNPGQTTISDIAVRNVRVQLSAEPELASTDVTDLTFTNVIVNDRPITAPPYRPPDAAPPTGYRVSG
jgi:alpha-L-rhamnosidase